MDEDNATPPWPSCSGYNGEKALTAPEACPLCKTELKLFFINFNEKILMCENLECEFPFGTEKMHFLKEDQEVQFDEEVLSIKSKNTQDSQGASSSVGSAAAWSDIDKLNQAFRGETHTFPQNSVSSKIIETSKRLLILERDNEEIARHIEDIKLLNVKLSANLPQHAEDEGRITNAKWISNLRSLQEKSGVQLLKPDEMGLSSSEETRLALGELKIDIEPAGDAGMSSIKIQIQCKNPRRHLMDPDELDGPERPDGLDGPERPDGPETLDEPESLDGPEMD